MDTSETFNTLLFKSHCIYTKSCVFNATTITIDMHQDPPQPTLESKVKASFSSQEKEVYEAILNLEVTAKHNGNLLWHVQLQQAGLYTLDKLNNEQQQFLLKDFCMNQLYSYACAEVSRLVIQGGFLSVYRNLMNFGQLYLQEIQDDISLNTKFDLVNLT